MGSADHHCGLQRLVIEGRTHLHRFGRFGYGIRLDTPQLFPGGSHTARDGVLHTSAKEIVAHFIIVFWRAIMGNVPCRFTYTLAQFFYPLLLPLLLLLPLRSFIPLS